MMMTHWNRNGTSNDADESKTTTTTTRTHTEEMTSSEVSAEFGTSSCVMTTTTSMIPSLCQQQQQQREGGTIMPCTTTTTTFPSLSSSSSSLLLQLVRRRIGTQCRRQRNNQQRRMTIIYTLIVLVLQLWSVLDTKCILLPGVGNNKHHNNNNNHAVHVVVTAEKDSNPYPYGNNPNNQFTMYWNDAANVLQDLSKFSALFIKYHGCVWSECHVDQYDDDGENRDGDEYWYQYRTQPFCANAAYSLYGTLRRSGPIGAMFSRSCSRATYINSFFTYGGADTMFQALTLHSGSSLTTFDSMNDDASNTHPNSECYTIEDASNNNNNNNNNKDNNGNSAAADDGLSSTMGCSAESHSKFVVAEFEGTTCDGNYFLQTSEKLPSYNRIIQTVRCKQIWNYHRHYKNSIAYTNDQASGTTTDDGERRLTRQQLQINMLRQQQIHREMIGNMTNLYIDTTTTDRELGDNNNNNNENNNGQSYSYVVYNSPAENLLANSWACDISVYPNGCPDPYGLKKKYDSILQAVANGRNPRLVLTNAELKQPITILSYVTLLVGLGLCFSAYYIRNKQRMKQMGMLPMIGSDLKYSFVSCCSIFSDTLVWCCAGCWACIIGMGRKLRGGSSGKKTKRQRQEEKVARREEKLRKKQQSRKHRQFSFTSGGSGSDASSTRRGSSRPASAGRALSQSRRKRYSHPNDDDDDMLDIAPSSSNKTGTSRKSSSNNTTKSHRRSSSGTDPRRKTRSKSSSRIATTTTTSSPRGSGSSKRYPPSSSSHYRNMEDDDDDDEFASAEEQQRYVRHSLGGTTNPTFRSDIV